MNKKAELFKAYLEEKNITAFQVEEVNDQLNTVVFRSVIAVEGQELPTLVITDDSIFTMIRVRVANAALKEENKANITEAINKMNAQYKIFKYYFLEDGTLIMDSYVLNKPEEIDGDMIYTVLDVIVKHIVPEYKNIMKTIWA